MDNGQTSGTALSKITSCRISNSGSHAAISRDDQYRHLLVDESAMLSSRSRIARAYRKVKTILKELDGRKADEHGGWETGIGHPTRRRTVAINVDLYGIDEANGQPLGVVQVRRYEKKDSWEFSSIRKNYFLVGRNELTKTAFAHPIPSAVVHAAIRRDPSASSPVTAARAWIFEVDRDRLGSILRHGDVALVPVRRLPSGNQQPQVVPFDVVDSHRLSADRIVRIGERLYALNPHLTHEKGQHADVCGMGWHRVQVGLRASFWQFASPTAD